MHVVFVEPAFPQNQREFVRGLKEVGAIVTGVGERPLDALDPDLRSWLTHYQQIGSVCDEASMTAFVRALQARVPVDRLEATVEAHIMPIAHVREACGIDGTSTRTAFLCRDKPAMKEVLRDGGIPCAHSLGTDSVEEAVEFARRVGYPIIVKPRAGAGAADTERVDGEDQMAATLDAMHVGRGGSVALEEYVTGHEAFYDTICAGGAVLHDFVTHYYPNVLEAMRNRWISPQFIASNRIDTAPDYREVRELGRRVIDLLGITTSATHMEWFFGERGLKFSEIGCRPPGVRAWDLYAAANEIDIYREWAMAIVHGRAERGASRRYSAGIIALRPNQDGEIAGYEGLEPIQDAFGEWILDAHLPPPGTPTQPVAAGYMANAWLRMRHPDYDELRRMLDAVGETVKVYAR